MRSTYSVREERDADRPETSAPYSEYKTAQHPNGVLCSTCGRQFFIDDLTMERSNRAAAEGFEDQFLCEGCLEDRDEAFYTER